MAENTTSTIRIRRETKERLEELAKETGTPVPELLEKALREYERAAFFRRLNAGYAALRADPVAWKEICQERAAWDATLADGLQQP